MRKRLTLGLVVLLLLALGVACDTGSENAETTEPPKPPAQSAVFKGACAGTLVASTAGVLASTELAETSGLVVSAKNPGTLWANNDSGDSARVFAISDTGTLLGIYTGGATAIDWEDMAIGPGPQPKTPYLFVGDIGDNGGARPNVVVYRVAEPKVVGDGATSTLDAVDALTLRYPDGPHDAEALMVDPRSGALSIVIKHLVGGPAGVYRAPAGLAGGSTTTLERVGEIRLGIGLLNAVTASDISRDGNTIGVRTYGGVRLWSRTSEQSVIAALGARPCRGPIPFEMQGETIALAPDGRRYFTVSEGVSVPLHQFTARASGQG